MSDLRIAILGGRGIPACYGGFETLMEELGPRLVERGHDVTVYCRSRYTPPIFEQHRGVGLVRLPSLYTKHLETPVHTALASLHASRERFDVALVVNGVNAIFAPLLQLVGTPVALNVDGIERQRAKWGRLGRTIYSISERMAVCLPRAIIADAQVIETYYRETYGARCSLIAYGVDPQPLAPGKILHRLGLEPRKYFLYVSRFEPENNPHRVAEAYRGVGGDLPLVMVGDAPYASDFIRSFTQDSDPRVRFPGAIYGTGYRELLSNALGFVQATEVGGTHPALVEAMGYGNCLVVHGTPENREVAGDVALYFDMADAASLTRHLEGIRADPAEARALGDLAAARARAHYSWDAVTEAYEALFRGLVDSSRG